MPLHDPNGDNIYSVAAEGTRVYRTGDAHPSQAAALVAFHNLNFIRENLESSIKGSGAGMGSLHKYLWLSLL